MLKRNNSCAKSAVLTSSTDQKHCPQTTQPAKSLARKYQRVFEFQLLKPFVLFRVQFAFFDGA
jgi:hypothetical protein